VEDFWDRNSHVILSVVGALLVLLAGWILALLLKRATLRFLRKREGTTDASTLTRLHMLQRLSTVIIMLAAGIIALYVVDIPGVRRVAVGMFASAGLAGIALAFAARTTAANLISGIMISFVQPLRLGDRVEIGTDSGQVEEIGLFYTHLKTWDNRRVIIPNEFLSKNVIRNYTVKDARMPAVVTFRFAYGVDVVRLRSLLLDLARAQQYFVEEPEPSVQVVQIDDAGITVRLVAWSANQPEASDFAVVLREEALRRLAEDGQEWLPSSVVPSDGPGGGDRAAAAVT
jgi:small-conductance mechanosensitive channel